MPVLTFDEFKGGLDVRQLAALTRGNILRVLTNAYITTGKSIKKRPCLDLVAALEPGTVGLKAINGRLNTFYGQGAQITHANALFLAQRVPHHTSGAAPTKIHYGDQFNALPYVVAEYADGTIRHHYLDDPGAWAATTAYTAGDYARPTTANGFRYEATTGTTGGSEPVWPTSIGGAVVDGTVTWTCASFAVADVNCPHSKQVTKRQQKIYAADGANVAYCATGFPRDWTSASDAGFIPAGLQALGSDQVSALGEFNDNLVILFADSAQVWDVASDPAANALTNNVENVGTIFHRAARALAGDLFFLAQNGFRSISLAVVTNNLQDQDVGNPIDALVRASISETDDPIAVYFPTLGQWWCVNGDTAWVYSFSKTSKLSAWSKFTLPYTITDVAVLNQKLYLRSGDYVYRATEEVYKDGGASIPLVDIEFYYQDADRPGVLKQIMGMDVLGEGSPTISFKYFDEGGVEREAASYEYPAITEPGAQNPVEICATRIAPHITHQRDEAFEFSQISLFYENLGVV